jgi:8-oxo-dGTP pyrophosphatase MutT (NUDIX family)
MSECKKVQLVPTMQELIDDLISRFFLSLKREDVENDMQAMYNMEIAYWHFQDFFADRYSNLPKLNFKTFTQSMIDRMIVHNIPELKSCPLLGALPPSPPTSLLGDSLPSPSSPPSSPSSSSSSPSSPTGSTTETESIKMGAEPPGGLRGACPLMQELCSRYRKYMCTVPVNGCIILSKDMKHCLVVRSYTRNIWNFPKGKLKKGETDEECAIREVWEEVGLNVGQLIDKNNFLYIDENVELCTNITKRRTKLFIIPMIDKETTNFKTNTRKEIHSIEWIPISEIPFACHKPNRYNRHLWALTKFERKLRDYIKSVSIKKNYFKKPFFQKNYPARSFTVKAF